MFGIDVDAASKIVAAAVGAVFLALLTWIGNRKNRQDAAERPAQPAGMGIVLDGDTAQQLVRELKDMHADMVRWRREDSDRAKDNHIADLEDRLARLQQGQGTTHGNQGEILGGLAEIRELLALPGVIEEVERHREARSRTAPPEHDARLGVR